MTTLHGSGFKTGKKDYVENIVLLNHMLKITAPSAGEKDW